MSLFTFQQISNSDSSDDHYRAGRFCLEQNPVTITLHCVTVTLKPGPELCFDTCSFLKGEVVTKNRAVRSMVLVSLATSNQEVVLCQTRWAEAVLSYFSHFDVSI